MTTFAELESRLTGPEFARNESGEYVDRSRDAAYARNEVRAEVGNIARLHMCVETDDRAAAWYRMNGQSHRTPEYGFADAADILTGLRAAANVAEQFGQSIDVTRVEVYEPTFTQ